jgi:hypothetical protein
VTADEVLKMPPLERDTVSGARCRNGRIEMCIRFRWGGRGEGKVIEAVGKITRIY